MQVLRGSPWHWLSVFVRPRRRPHPLRSQLLSRLTFVTWLLCQKWLVVWWGYIMEKCSTRLKSRWAIYITLNQHCTSTAMPHIKTTVTIHYYSYRKTVWNNLRTDISGSLCYSLALLVSRLKFLPFMSCTGQRSMSLRVAGRFYMLLEPLLS